MPRGTGSAIYSNVALTDTAILVQTGKCSLTWYHIFNTTAAECYVHFYDAAAAADVTLGTPVPTFVRGIPAEAGAGLGAGACCALPRPAQFTKGMVVGSLTTAGDTSHTGAITVVTFGVGD